MSEKVILKDGQVGIEIKTVTLDTNLNKSCCYIAYNNQNEFVYKLQCIRGSYYWLLLNEMLETNPIYYNSLAGAIRAWLEAGWEIQQTKFNSRNWSFE